MSDLAESFSYMSRFRCPENLERSDVWILGFFIPVLRTFNTLEVQKKPVRSEHSCSVRQSPTFQTKLKHDNWQSQLCLFVFANEIPVGILTEILEEFGFHLMISFKIAKIE